MTTPRPIRLSHLHQDQWRRLEAVLDTVLDCPDSERMAAIEAACANDAELRARVLAFLDADASAQGFLEAPPDLPLIEPEPPAPSRVGPWRIVREIGRGGMGAVYLAERADGQFEQRVALKLIKRGLDTDEILQRFRNERQILARLEHPGIARLLDGGATEDGRPYVAMEYVDGLPLDAYCQTLRPHLSPVLGLLTQICGAVEYAHTNLVVHRDLKPTNILIGADGQAKLLDFGIAKVLNADGDTMETRTLGSRMTPRYASPEQVRGLPPTTATDVYALGVILYELITSHSPYGPKTESRVDLEQAILEQDPAAPSLVPGVPNWDRSLHGDLDNIVLKALRKEPEFRYSSVQAFRADLESFLALLPVSATPPTFAYRSRKFFRRHRVGILAAGLVVFSLIAGLAGTLWQARAASRARDRALLEATKANQVKEFTLGLFTVSDPSESRGADITARDLLERGTERVERELSQQPAVRAEMLQVLASIYWKLGEFGVAETLASRSVDLARSSSVPKDQLASSLRWKGVAERDRAEYAASHNSLNEALAIRRALSGEDRSFAETLSELASVYSHEGQQDSAEALYRRVIDLDGATLGSEAEALATDWNNLGSVLLLEERQNEAVSAFRTSLDIWDKTRGNRDHQDAANALASLGLALAELGRYAEAESCQAQALATRLRILRPDHYDLANSYGLYAELKRQTGDYDAAFDFYEKGLQVLRRAVGPDHPDVSRELNNLAILYYQRGQYPLALERFREALTIRNKTLPANDRGTLTMENNIGCVLRAMGEYDEAERILRDVRSRRLKTLGAGHMDIANSDHHLGILFHLTGHDMDAERYLRAALAIRDTLEGGAQLTAQTCEALAGLLRDRGDYNEADSLYRRAIAINAEVFPDPSPQSAEALVGWGRLLLLQQRPKDAEKPLRDALAIRRSALSSIDPRTAEAAVALGVCAYQLRRRAEAESLLSEGIPELKAAPGAPAPLLSSAEAALEALQNQ